MCTVSKSMHTDKLTSILVEHVPLAVVSQRHENMSMDHASWYRKKTCKSLHSLNNIVIIIIIIIIIVVKEG